jgi:microcin C transport system ATP-binding protein
MSTATPKPPSPNHPPLLQVQGLEVAFAGRTVVHGVDFSIQAGERLALVGESGSGKTLTALSLLGLVQGARTGGHALWQGGASPVDLLHLPERALQRIRGDEIAMVFQEPMSALNPLFSIGEQIAEVLRLKRGLAPKESARTAIDLIAKTGIPEAASRARAYPHQLSGGQRQRAMIAMALACRPRLLLADEPTTALDVSVRRQILDLLIALQREEGMAVMLITHDLPLVQRFAHRVAVMEQGRIVEQGAVAEVFAAPQHAYTQRLLASRPVRDVVPTAPHAKPVLQAQGLSVSYPVPLPGLRGWWKQCARVAVADVTLQLGAGQTLGVVGESGSGKSTLALAALGLLPFEGQLLLMGQPWGRGAAQDKALRKSVQVVFQDPFSSLSPRLTVQDIVGEGLLVHAPSLPVEQRRQRVLAALAEVGLDDSQFPGLLQRYAHQFSGGQRQRLAIARALIVQPDLLVLDEPTSALDVTLAQQVLQLLQRLQKERGLAYLLITHDVAVVRAMAHHVVVVHQGRIVESGPLEQVLHQPAAAYTQALLEAAQ